eukprot:c12217_g1_i1 orf=171-434(+)
MHPAACDHMPFAVADDIIPELINLTNFTNGAFWLSPYNHYLLFSCTNHKLSSTMATVKEDTQDCQDYLSIKSYARRLTTQRSCLVRN